MSYEGYEQVLCRNGHSRIYDAHDTRFDGFFPARVMPEAGEKTWRCDNCGEMAGWVNSVDDTNCDAYGHVDLVEVHTAEVQTCNLGHQHVIKEATYSPPNNCEFGQFVNGGLK